MLKQPELFRTGYHLTAFVLPPGVERLIEAEDWTRIDQLFRELTAPDGALYLFLRTFHDFQTIEFIISVRDSSNPWEEDGIWHDDGSRVFAFSLSLTLVPEKIEGGKLGIRKKEETIFNEIETPSFGEIILFLTGLYGYEHKIHRVIKGKRIIIAGWCS